MVTPLADITPGPIHLHTKISIGAPTDAAAIAVRFERCQSYLQRDGRLRVGTRLAETDSDFLEKSTSAQGPSLAVDGGLAESLGGLQDQVLCQVLRVKGVLFETDGA